MRIAPLSLTIALLLGSLAHAEGPLPLEVAHPEKLAADNPVQTVGGIISDSLGTPTSTPLPVNVPAMPEEQKLLLQMTQREQGKVSPSSNSPQNLELGESANDVWAEMVKSKYSPTQTLIVRPSGNVMVPVSLGLMNRIETNFKNVSVKTSDEAAVLEVDGGVLYLTINKSEAVGLILMEQGVPNSAINLTAVPVDVPPALVKVRIPMSGDMLNDAYQYQRKNREAEMVDKAISEEEEIVRSDRHTERIKEILRTTALGQVPAGFSLADDLSEVPRGYKVPCKFQGLTNKLGQRMVGAREYIDVVLVSNNTTYESNIKEEMCLSRDALAVGVMDAAALRAGASTEVYIVRDKNWSKKQQQMQTRPRLDNNGTFGLNGYRQVAGGKPFMPTTSAVK